MHEVILAKLSRSNDAPVKICIPASHSAAEPGVKQPLSSHDAPLEKLVQCNSGATGGGGNGGGGSGGGSRGGGDGAVPMPYAWYPAYPDALVACTSPR